MGIWRRPHDDVPRRAARRVRLRAAREHGLDTVDTLAGDARRQGQGVLRAWAATSSSATPDTDAHRGGAARRSPDRARLDQAQPLARRRPAREALILPCLGRTERDVQDGGEQVVTVEDSMGMVHASRGPARPGVAAPALRGRDRHRGSPRRCSARRQPGIDWGGLRRRLRPDPRPHRAGDPGLRAVQRARRGARRLRAAAPAARPARVQDRDRQGAVHRQRRSTSLARPRGPPAAADGAQPRPVQHHDLRPRRPLPRHQAGTPGGVREPDRPAGARLRRRRDGRPRQRRRADGERRAEDFRIVSYATARGCAAAYFPETNVLVALDSVAKVSNTPVSKSIVVRLEHRTEM